MPTNTTDAYDMAVDTAATAVRGLRPALLALEQIAELQFSCPLAAEIAVRGLREMKAEIAPSAPVLSPERHLGLVSEDALERATGGSRR